jgi:hypothetical protein
VAAFPRSAGNLLICLRVQTAPAISDRSRSPPCRPYSYRIAPIRYRRLGPLALGHLRCFRLDLVATIPAPHDQPRTGSRGVAQRHRRPGRTLSESTLPFPGLLANLPLTKKTLDKTKAFGLKPLLFRSPEVPAIGC